MRRIRYVVATSLDGYIAGPNGEANWIVMDPEIDFGELYAQFDTVLVGRRTFEPMVTAGKAEMPGMEIVVFSTKLRREDHPDVSVVSDNVFEAVDRLRRRPGKDIWLLGGGVLFQNLSALGLVDTVEVAVIPKLIGGGIPLYPPPAQQLELVFKNQRVFAHSGVVSLHYSVVRDA